MSIISVEEAQARLPELIAALQQGGEILITRDHQPVAKLVPAGTPSNPPRQPGSAKGLLTIVAEDDEHLKDFADYMP